MAPPPTPLGRDYISALEDKISALSVQIDKRIESERMSVALALTAADKTTAIAQDTADKAVAKAEAAAGKEYLESQIAGLRDALVAQIIAQKEAIAAALNATEKALSAAQASSEKAILKAEESNEKRFSSVNEFRGQLGDQQKTFITKDEVNYRFASLEKKFEELAIWQRNVDLKFSNYLSMDAWNTYAEEKAAWRRRVDEQLTVASSKSGFIASLIAMAISIGVLLIGLFNLFTKVSH